jgi:phosphatidylserine/phosphatidylglycerophosphate/cardiolipin synthase-like enzyme
LGYYLWIGKDYANFYHKDISEIDKPSLDQFDRQQTPRMPWRDQGLMIVGDAARDLARHFIQVFLFFLDLNFIYFIAFQILINVSVGIMSK